MMIESNDEDKPIKSWLPYVIGMACAATLSALGSELARWGVEELRKKLKNEPKEEKDE
jgi:hypothetical protein